MMNSIDALSSAVTKATKSYVANRKGRFVKSADVVADVCSNASIKSELGMFRTTIHNAILRVVKAHNESVASDKDAVAKGKTLGGSFPQLEGLL